MYDPNLLTDTERGPPEGLQALQAETREVQTTSNPASTFQYTAAELFYLHETPPSTRFQPTPGTARQIPHVSKIFTSSPVPLPATYRLPRRHHYQLPAINTNTSTTPYISYSRNEKEAITHQRKDSGYESCAYMFMGIPDQNEEEEDGDGNDIDAWCNAVLAHTPLTAPNRYTYSLLRPDAPEFYPLVNNSTTKKYHDSSAKDFGEGRPDCHRSGDEDRHTILGHAPLALPNHHIRPLRPDAPVFYPLIDQSHTRIQNNDTPPPSSPVTNPPSTTTKAEECGNRFAVTEFEMKELDYEGLSSRLGFEGKRDTSSEGLCEGGEVDDDNDCGDVGGCERGRSVKGCRWSI